MHRLLVSCKIEYRISYTHRKKTESTESLDQIKREQSLQRVIYQREGEIPRSPLEAQLQKSYFSIKDLQPIPFFKIGSYPPRTIKISEAPVAINGDFMKMYHPQMPLTMTMPMPMSMSMSMQMPNPMSMSMSMPLTVPPPPPPPPPAPSYAPLLPHTPMAPTGMNQMGHPLMPVQSGIYAGHTQQPQPPPPPRLGPLPSAPIPQYNAMMPSMAIYDPAVLANPMDPYSLMNKTRALYNPVTKKPQNYRTVPCRRFHSADGCERGDNCHFIHDFQFQGRPIPNFQDWKNNNVSRQRNMQGMNNYTMGVPAYYPPQGPDGNYDKR